MLSQCIRRANHGRITTSIIVIPLTGIDTDRQLLLSANLLQLEEVA